MGKMKAMIYDTLEHIEQYRGIHEGIMKGLRFLAETDLSQAEPGRIEIDGENVVALIQHYDTRPQNETPETHWAHADIQYVIDGAELVAVGPKEAMSTVVEERPEQDVAFHRGPVQPLLLTGRRFVVLWPGDAHAPCIAPDGLPSSCRKCVIKVRL